MKAEDLAGNACGDDVRLLLEQGCELLRSLGQPQLALDFRQQGRGIDSRDALTELLLACLSCRHRDD